MAYTLTRTLTSLLMATTLSATGAFAVDPLPVQCPEGLLVQDVPGLLFRADTFQPVAGFAANDPEIEFNNLGWRSTDQQLYAVKLTPTGNDGLIRIDGAFNVTEYGDLGGALPADERLDAGTVSSDGTTYYAHTGSEDHIFVVDLTALDNGAPEVETFYFDATGNVHDWAYFPDLDPAEAMLFGATTDGHISRLELISGTVIRTDSPSAILPAGVAYGGARFNAAGELLVYRNSGEIFVLDVSALSATSDPVILDDTGFGRASTRNDATSCGTPSTCDEAFVMQDVGARLYQTDSSSLGFGPPVELCGVNTPASPGGDAWSRSSSSIDPDIPADLELNNMCYRKDDDRIYALELDSGGNSGLVRFDPDTCVLESIEVTGLPENKRFDAGDCFGDQMLVNIAGVKNQFYLLDVTTGEASRLQVFEFRFGAGSAVVHDWAYNPADEKFYGGDSLQGQLASLYFDEEIEEWVREDRNLVGTPLPAGIAYGGAWFNAEGRLVLSRNETGELIEIDISSRKILTEASSDFTSGYNDGASCTP